MRCICFLGRCPLWPCAGEALGAIGIPKVLDVLREYSSDPVIEVSHFVENDNGNIMTWGVEQDRELKEKCRCKWDTSFVIDHVFT